MDKMYITQQHLADIRKMLGWSAQKLGEEIGVTRQTINKIENGKTPLSQTIYLALLYVLKRETSTFSADTAMLQCVLDILIFNSDYYSSTEAEQALKSAQILISPTVSSKITREEISMEWVKYNKRIYQKFFDRLLAEHQDSANMLNQLNPNGQEVSVFELKKEGVKKMKTMTRKDCVELFEEYDREIKDALFELYTSYVLDTVRHELWMYIDDEGKVSLKTNIGYASTILTNEQRFFIYSCGGENVTAWDLLPRLEYLLSAEDLRMFVDAVKKTSDERVTVTAMQKYIETEHPELIEEWLEEYFSDPTGYIEDMTQRVYEKILDRIDS